MKRAILILAILLLAVNAQAANYCVDATGGADASDGICVCSAGNCTGNAWQTLTKLNATTFSAGDTINLKKGETWMGMWTFLGSGTSGNEITITSYGTGAQPIINANSANARALYLNGNDYVIINGLHLQNATSLNFEAAGTTDGIQFLNNTTSGGVNQVKINTGASCTVSGNTINQGTGYGFSFQQATNSGGTLSNNAFVGNGTANTATVMAYVRGSAMTVSGNTATDWDMGGASPKLFDLSVTGLTMADNTATGCNGFNFFIGGSGVVASGTNTSTSSGGHAFNFFSAGMTSVDTLVVTSPTSGAVTFDATTGAFTVQNIQVTDASAYSAIVATGATVDMTIQNVDLNGGDGTGVAVGTSATVVINGGEVQNFAVDGISVDTAGIFNGYYIYSHNNGTTAVVGSGDGFNAKGAVGGATVNLYYCIGAKNMKSGIAYEGASTGVVYNCTFYDNYEASIEDDCGIRVVDTAIVTAKNNITMGHRHEIFKGATATLTTDYNLFYDSRGGLAFVWNGEPYNWADYLTASGQDVNSKNADPVFYDVSASDFRLTPASPAINAGTDLSLTRDYVGTTVPRGNAPDIGAYEFYGGLCTGQLSIPPCLGNFRGTAKIY